MNRRDFLVAVGAISVTAYITRLPTGVSERAIIKEIPLLGMPPNLQPWQQMLWAQLQKGTKVIFMTGTQQNANHVYNLMGRHKLLHCGSINGAIMGRRANLVVIDDFKDEINPDWYNSSIRTRLTPGNVDNIKWVYT